MHPLFTQPLTIAWNVTALEVSLNGYLSALCQKCQTKLDIHQPLESDPNELLGTCGHCGCWHLIQVSPDGAEALLFNVPGVDFVRETLAQARTAAEPKRPAGRRPRRRAKIGTNGQA